MAEAVSGFPGPLHHRQRPAFRSACNRAAGARAAERAVAGSASRGFAKEDRHRKPATALRIGTLSFSNGVIIRALEASEWEAFRDFRLDSLRAVPGVFATTYDVAARRSPEEW